jgi:menaquinone-dependent protoporphyrinogen IX oxidase
MSKGIILYQSKYGATKKYVDWLVEETGYECIETKTAKALNLQNYDVIILGGGVYASGIAGLQFLKKNICNLTDKKIVVFAVGASPYDEEAIMQIRNMHFKDTLSNIPLFYCRGAWDEEKMKFVDKTLCKMLKKAVAKQNPDEYEPWQKALMCAVGKKCDWTDKAYLEDLIKYIKESEEIQ